MRAKVVSSAVVAFDLLWSVATIAISGIYVGMHLASIKGAVGWQEAIETLLIGLYAMKC